MFSDLRVVCRSLARAPGYAITVILTLALGIGAAAALHSTLSGSLLLRFNFPRIDELVRIEAISQGARFSNPTFLARFLAYRERAKSFSALAGGTTETLNLVVNGEPEGVAVARVTANYFTVLGVAPLMGRTFLPNDEQPGSDNVALLTYSYWKNRFGADPAILGKEIRLNERNYQVVGVLPEDYRAPFNTAGGRLCVPLVVPPVATPQTAFNSMATIARLRPGVTLAAARTELRGILPEQGQPYAEAMGKFNAVLKPIDAPPEFDGYQRFVVMQWTGVVAVTFLYLIACVNAGSLMLVRSLDRRRDTGIRLALGAGRWAVARPLLIEALVLAATAIAFGVMVAKWLLPALMAVAPGSEENAFKAIALSWETLGYLALLGVLTGMLVASGPAWRAAQMNVNDAMKDGGQGTGESRRLRLLRNTLVVVEATLAVALLAGTGLMIRTFQRLQEYDPGFRTANRFVVNLRISRDENMKADVRLERFKQIVERLKTVPGVTGASFVGSNFAPSFFGPAKVKLSSRPDAGEVEAAAHLMMPDVLEQLGVPLRAGRSLAELRPGDPVSVVVSETFARNYFPGRSPLGERIEITPHDVWEIVGVVGDIRSARLEAKPRFYFPYWQQKGNTNFNVLVRTAAKPGPKFNSDLRRAIYEVEPKFAVMSVNSFEQQLRWEISTERFVMTALEVLGGLALLLAVLGLFAMIAYSVAQRRAEFGIRLTFGATPASLQWLVVRGGLVLAALGVALGLGIAWGLARLMTAVLYGTRGADPVIFGVVGLVMFVVALPACWWPARRAGQVDVVKLLRAE
ncbi:MAG: ABC transporter permease [Opitutae bacterium]|nr:ABC transporter permease [Opitutae bacterium]